MCASRWCCAAMSCRASSRAFGFWRSKTRQQKQKRKKEVTSQSGHMSTGQSWGPITLHSELFCCYYFFFVAPSRPQQEESRACVLCTIVQSFNLMSTAKSQATRDGTALRLPRSLSPPLFRSTWQRSAAQDCAITPDSSEVATHVSSSQVCFQRPIRPVGC